jgi:hypothetical protein
MHPHDVEDAGDCPPVVAAFLIAQTTAAGIGGRWQLVLRGEMDGAPVVLLAVAALLPTDENGLPEQAALADAVAGYTRPARPN